MKKKAVLTGAALATAVAIAFIGTPARATDNSGEAQAKVKCVGGNACKGQSACQTAATDCKGSNTCQSKGWIYTTDAKSCKDAGGKPQIVQSD
ncbi:MAG TPA: hypothetical protein VMU16_01205 [Candidatus Binataceae bacterium]|nr:hypothetical protein [Candidatus Binataceae bacterium]